MFSAYDLKIDSDFFDDRFWEYIEIGEGHLSSQLARFKNKIEKLVLSDTMSGSEIQNNCFPEVDADIFISHSHNDKDLANALAGWLNSIFRLKVFIDSNVWEYSNNLLKKINDVYSNKQKDANGVCIYDYDSCNYASQHVNLMLSTALQKMIDKVECVIFLNTDNSISVFDEDKKRINRTYSPWIYSEILSTQITRKKPLFYYREYKKKVLSHATESTSYMYALQVAYDVSLDHLTKLDLNDLYMWYFTYIGESYERYDYALDALYSFKNPKDLENAKKISICTNEEQKARLQIIKSAIDGDSDAQKKLEKVYSQICCEASNLNCTVCQGRRCQFKNN